MHVYHTRLKDDIIELFSCPKITRQVLNVRVIDDHGHLEVREGSDVLRDVLSTFWQHIFASLGMLKRYLPSDMIIRNMNAKQLGLCCCMV